MVNYLTNLTATGISCCSPLAFISFVGLQVKKV